MKLAKLKYKTVLPAFFFLVGLISCIEEINFENKSFEYVLIIDATITNEEKQHTIFINRAHRFEEDGPNKVTGATVQVLSDVATYTFEEIEAGTYVSSETFKALPNVTYRLQITTQDGNVYNSTTTQLTGGSAIDDLFAVRETNDDGVNGVSIYVDSFDPANTPKYYRYDFEETFQVVAPLWRSQDLVVISDDFPDCSVAFQPRSTAEITCYRTEVSNTINVATTAFLNDNNLQEHLVRFLSSDDYRISYRYSIVVNQYAINETSYNFWNAIDNFNSEGSIFSQVQAGFVAGNITSVNNPLERVVGFFDVSSMASKRIFFNYIDFYNDEPLPPFAVPCPLSAPKLFNQQVCGPLLNIISNNSSVYLEDLPPDNNFFEPGPYIMVPRPCGDCTALGTTEPPKFWID